MIFHQNKRDLHLQPSSVHTYFCVTFYEKVVLIVLNVMLYFRNIYIYDVICENNVNYIVE